MFICVTSKARALCSALEICISIYIYISILVYICDFE